MFASMIISAFALVLAIIVTLSRFNLRRFLGYAAAVDISFTILMFMMFAGTFSGIVAASFAGLFMTLMLTILKRAIGYEKLKRVGFKIKWVRFEPVWKDFIHA